MDRRKDTLCPWCGQEPENYFENLDPEDWTIIRPFSHAPDIECRKGCAALTRATFEFSCFYCGEWIAAACEYLQPCNTNGIVLEMVWEQTI